MATLMMFLSGSQIESGNQNKDKYKIDYLTMTSHTLAYFIQTQIYSSIMISISRKCLNLKENLTYHKINLFISRLAK